MDKNREHHLTPKKFLEDDFDLDELADKYHRSYVLKENERKKKTINILTVLIIFFSIIVVLLGYRVLAYYFNYILYYLE